VLHPLGHKGFAHSPQPTALYQDNGRPLVVIKDSKNKKTLKRIAFLSKAFNAKSVGAILRPDSGTSSALTVLGTGKTDGSLKAETRDSLTGERLSSRRF